MYSRIFCFARVYNQSTVDWPCGHANWLHYFNRFFCFCFFFVVVFFSCLCFHRLLWIFASFPTSRLKTTNYLNNHETIIDIVLELICFFTLLTLFRRAIRSIDVFRFKFYSLIFRYFCLSSIEIRIEKNSELSVRETRRISDTEENERKKKLSRFKK